MNTYNVDELKEKKIQGNNNIITSVSNRPYELIVALEKILHESFLFGRGSSVLSTEEEQQQEEQ